MSLGEHSLEPLGQDVANGPKKRAFLMLRVSDRKQANKYGPSAQRAESYEGGKECSIPLEFSPAREAFWTETASGWNRKQFNAEVAKRLEEFHRGEWDVLVFPRVDRETRFLAGSFEALSQMLRAGVPIYFAKHHLLLRQGDSEAFDIYFDLVRDARAYIKVLKSNTMGGRIQAMEAGQIPSGWGPKGLSGYDWKDRRFVKNSANTAVEAVLRLYLEGYSESAIMRELKARRLFTAVGKPFAQSTVSKVLHHARWYAGIILYSGREFRGLIEPLISEDEAALILARLSKHKTGRLTAFGRAHWWTGRVLCGLCHRRYSNSKSHGCRCNGRDTRTPEPCLEAPTIGFQAFMLAVSEALRLTLSHPETIFEQISQHLESRGKELAFLAAEHEEKKEKLSDINHRLQRLSRQHEMGLINDAELRERSAEVVRDSQDIQTRVHELERLLSAPAPCSLDGIAGLVEEFREAFHLEKGSPADHLMSASTAIAARWVDDLGMPGTWPSDEIWERLANKLNLYIRVYPPQEAEVAGKSVKATLRIVGDFPPAATTRVVEAGVQAATVTTPSSPP